MTEDLDKEKLKASGTRKSWHTVQNPFQTRSRGPNALHPSISPTLELLLDELGGFVDRTLATFGDNCISDSHAESNHAMSILVTMDVEKYSPIRMSATVSEMHTVQNHVLIKGISKFQIVCCSWLQMTSSKISRGGGISCVKLWEQKKKAKNHFAPFHGWYGANGTRIEGMEGSRQFGKVWWGGSWKQATL